MKGTRAQQQSAAVSRPGIPSLRFSRLSVFGWLCLFALTGQAASPAPYTISVPVIDVQPVLTSKTVEQPVRQCREVVHQTRYHSENYRDHYDEPNTFVPGLIGGLFGGLIGNQFGGGNGKKALTVIGALAGSSIARQSARERYRRQTYYDDYREPERVCTTRYETQTVEQVSGYDVTYEYGGALFTKRTSYHPGERLSVRVEVSPEPLADSDHG